MYLLNSAIKIMAIFVGISKIDAAKRELEHSIRLFFSQGDIVVIHLVACSSYSILTGLGKTMGVGSMREELLTRVRKDKIRYVQRKLDEPFNFFKHALRDPNDILKFSPESSEFVIWDSINIYQKITKEITGLMMSFRLWFYLKNSELLLKTEEKEYFKEAGNKIDINDRSFFLQAAEIFENKRTNRSISGSY